MSTVRIPALAPLGRAAAAGDLVPIWDGVEGATRQVDVSELPGTDGGGGGGTVTTSPSPFKVYTGSANYSYDGGANTVKVLDARLLNKTGYPVFATQDNMELDDSQLTYNAVDPDDDTKGSVVIANFQLDIASHLTITVPSSLDPTGDAIYAALLADVALLKQIAAPFMTTALGANGAKVWWTGGAIPAGWQECVAMRGLLPLAQDSGSADPRLTAALGSSGGASLVTLLPTNIPQLSAAGVLPKKIVDVDRGTTGGHSLFSLDDAVDLTIGTDGGDLQAVDVTNPYKLGIWIEFIGV